MALFPGLFHSRFACLTTVAALLSSCVVLSAPAPAQAGCGCDKPPPELAAIRPNATYAGRDVTLTHANLQSGQSYEVTFTSGMTGDTATVAAVAVTQRDLADSQEKPQLVVTVPALPVGPTSLSVSLAGQTAVVMATPDDVFTLAPQPLVFTEDVGTVSVPDYQAAVSRSGVVYISLDVTGMQLPRTFTAQVLGYPLRFTNNDVVFHNTQGFLMQLLDEGMPGLFAIDAATGSVDSDTLQYARHEFHTYFLQHAERQTHTVDPTDPNWHEDGTPHIDHDHLIVAISGMLDDGSTPEPGATPPTELVLSAQSFFEQGLVGDSMVSLSGTATTDSYHTATGQAGSQGDVLSNGEVSLISWATVTGDVTAPTVSVSSKATVLGQTLPLDQPVDFLPVTIPPALPDLGSLVVNKHDVVTLTGPESFQVSELLVYGGQLIIDNSDGPVTVYVTGPVSVSGGGSITVADPNPEKFALYVQGPHTVTLSGRDTTFYGVVYAPQAWLTLSGDSDFYGAFVGDWVDVSGKTRLHYDPFLRGE